MVTGYSLRPRVVFRYDNNTDSLFASPNFGSGCVSLAAADINHDGTDEVVLGTSSSANYPDTAIIPFNDNKSWVIILNKRLQPVDSLAFQGKSAATWVYPVRDGDSTRLLINYMNAGTENIPNHAALYNSKLQRIKDLQKWETEDAYSLAIALPYEGRDAVYQFFNNGRLAIYNARLHLIRLLNLKDEPLNISFIDSIRVDNRLIFLLRDMITKRLLFMEPGGRMDASLKYAYKSPLENFQYFGTRHLHAEADRFFALNGDQLYEYEMQRNICLYICWIVPFGIYAGFLFVLFLSQRLQHLRSRRQLRARQEILQVQLNSALGQLEPHFNFNAMNTMGMLISSGDKASANKYLQHFSRLLRLMLVHSDQVTIPLTEELEFIRDYLELQRYSLGEKL